VLSDVHSYIYTICISVAIRWQHINAAATIRLQATSTRHSRPSPRVLSHKPPDVFPSTTFRTLTRQSTPHTCNLPKGLVIEPRLGIIIIIGAGATWSKSANTTVRPARE
jgi:hypothetical protein